jgi:hypothetical protein
MRKGRGKETHLLAGIVVERLPPPLVDAVTGIEGHHFIVRHLREMIKRHGGGGGPVHRQRGRASSCP